MASLLVVDDDARVCDVLRRLLARAGYVVTCAGGGEEALALLRDLRPDLVILDWMMPGLDGLGVLRRLRADPATAAIPVMVYTASDEPQVARDAAALGALDCVPKVGRYTDLRERIECCLALATRRVRGGEKIEERR
jgi:CheY-like chemotaxis protein